MWILKSALLLLASLLLVACASSPYPLGMTQEQWQKLTPSERKSLLLKQQAYDEEQRLARIETQGKQRELELALELKESQRLNKLYDSSRGGDVIMVNLLGGQFQLDKKTYQIQPETLLIARGETKNVSLHLKNAKGKTRSKTVYLKYNRAGTGLFIYVSSPSSYNRNYLAILRDGQWHCGSQTRQHYAFSKHTKIHNLQLFVKERHSRCRPSMSRPIQQPPVNRPTLK